VRPAEIESSHEVIRLGCYDRLQLGHGLVNLAFVEEERGFEPASFRVFGVALENQIVFLPRQFGLALANVGFFLALKITVLPAGVFLTALFVLFDRFVKLADAKVEIAGLKIGVGK
jgi:hypothetical protein